MIKEEADWACCASSCSQSLYCTSLSLQPFNQILTLVVLQQKKKKKQTNRCSDCLENIRDFKMEPWWFIRRLIGRIAFCRNVKGLVRPAERKQSDAFSSHPANSCREEFTFSSCQIIWSICICHFKYRCRWAFPLISRPLPSLPPLSLHSYEVCCIWSL